MINLYNYNKTSVKQIQSGFTLIELMVVMAIIAVLASIALPRFSDYRKRAFDTRALSDLRNIAAAEEVYFLDSESYMPCNNDGCSKLPGITRLSNGTSITVQVDQDSFFAESQNSKGTGKRYTWDSKLGGLQD